MKEENLKSLYQMYRKIIRPNEKYLDEKDTLRRKTQKDGTSPDKKAN